MMTETQPVSSPGSALGLVTISSTANAVALKFFLYDLCHAPVAIELYRARTSARLKNLQASSLTLAPEPQLHELPQRGNRWWNSLYLALLTLLALAVHGYHLGTEDQAMYLPAIKKLVNPALYSPAAECFLAQRKPSPLP